MTKIKVFGPTDERSRQQLETCVIASDEPAPAVLCADHHPGYSMPIGGVLALKESVIPAGVGYDIACGNCAVRTNLNVKDVIGVERWRLSQGAAGEAPPETATDTSQGRETTLEGKLKNAAPTRADSILRSNDALSQVMDEIWHVISFGMGRNNDEHIDEHPVYDRIANSPVVGQRKLLQIARNQLGTVGSGNHYVDLLEDRADGRLWVGVHFGSRGLGHKTCTGFLSLAVGKDFDEHTAEGGMDDAPTLLSLDSPLGQDYLAAMQIAGEYAYAGRNWVVDRVLKILGATDTHRVHNHHNFAWEEIHGGEKYIVIRKGATPAFPGQQGFIGGTMGDDAVIVEGVDTLESAEALYSTVHGAGRVMSRTQAAGKVKRKTVWSCGQRDCSGELPIQTERGLDGSNPKCPRCNSKMHKRLKETRVRDGVVDWPNWQAKLKAQGVELRGAGADEAPECYKRLTDVLAYHGNTIKVLHTLRPIGVAMAGADVFDPYKD